MQQTCLELLQGRSSAAPKAQARGACGEFAHVLYFGLMTANSAVPIGILRSCSGKPRRLPLGPTRGAAHHQRIAGDQLKPGLGKLLWIDADAG